MAARVVSGSDTDQLMRGRIRKVATGRQFTRHPRFTGAHDAMRQRTGTGRNPALAPSS